MGSSRVHLYGHQRLETRKKPVVFRHYRRVLDGNDFISPELYSKGCVGVAGNRVCDGWDKGFVHVEGNGNVNSINSLIHMACYARNSRFNGVLVGVTGSVWKSTTKRMISLALENLGIDLFESYGNWNNRIGGALSLIGIDNRNADIAVLEMGMSGKGEILELARMAKPHIRVVLNVGASHLESLTSLEEVAMAKGEIFRDAKSGDVCILNGHDPLVTSLPVPYGIRKVLFGKRMGCHVRLVAAENTDGGLGVRVILEKGKEISLYMRLSTWFMEKGTGREAKFVIDLKLLMDS